MSKAVSFFYKMSTDGKETKVPYEWAKGEKEEYLKVCENANGWGGIPLDVNWAKSTIPYKESLNNLTQHP